MEIRNTSTFTCNIIHTLSSFVMDTENFPLYTVSKVNVAIAHLYNSLTKFDILFYSDELFEINIPVFQTGK